MLAARDTGLDLDELRLAVTNDEHTFFIDALVALRGFRSFLRLGIVRRQCFHMAALTYSQRNDRDRQHFTLRRRDDFRRRRQIRAQRARRIVETNHDLEIDRLRTGATLLGYRLRWPCRAMADLSDPTHELLLRERV